MQPCTCSHPFARQRSPDVVELRGVAQALSPAARTVKARSRTRRDRRAKHDQVARVCAQAGNQEHGSAHAGLRETAEGSAESSGVQLPTHLNSVPHAREARHFFYEDAAAAAQAAIRDNWHRIQLRCTIPELNPAMDVYRIGTLLELARELAETFAQDGDHVKVCVQQSMGQGVFQGALTFTMLGYGGIKIESTRAHDRQLNGLPLSLSGVRRIMEAMDWGDIADFIHFGQVGADQIDDCKFYVLIAPQNVVGSTIMTNLNEMVVKAEEDGKYLILINPLLKDIPSADAVMGIRGRKERMQISESFQPAYHFRLLYLSSAMMFPIMGALRHCHGGPWEVYKRVALGKREEEYRLVATFDQEPVGAKMTKLFIR